MPSLTKIVIDKVAENCIDLYKRLPKSGKPTEKEWTVLSCFLKYDTKTEDMEVVSLGTGSKCIGSTKLSPNGDIMNDSHAEVFARRGFLIYLYDNMDKSLNSEPSIFVKVDAKFKLKENVEFLFYSSQLPCGDASILPKNGVADNYGEVLQKKRKLEESEGEGDSKRHKVSDDIYRTGAKCLPHSIQDMKLPGKEYHLLGQVRTKPGRGEPTLSLSCSDKIARWINVGVQGALLDILCHPIYIKYFVFGGGVPYSDESIERAFLRRNEDYSVDIQNIPEFYQSLIQFPDIKTDIRSKATHGSIVWVKLRNPILEVAILGKKLGATKKKSTLQNSSLCISKYNLYKRFLSVLVKMEELKQNIASSENVASIPYNVMKKKSEHYLNKWSMVKENFFKTWTIKPDIWNFCVDVT